MSNQPSDYTPGWSFFALMLPYLEQGNLGNRSTTSCPILHPNNKAARETLVKLYVCPSDTSPRLIDLTDSGPTTWAAPNTYTYPPPIGPLTVLGQASVCSYAGCLGTLGYEEQPFTGVFHRNSRVRIADITDGTSNTVGVGERTSRFSENSWVGPVWQQETVYAPTAPRYNPAQPSFQCRATPTAVLVHVRITRCSRTTPTTARAVSSPATRRRPVPEHGRLVPLHLVLGEHRELPRPCAAATAARSSRRFLSHSTRTTSKGTMSSTHGRSQSIHADRAAGRDRDHRDPDRPAAARRAEGPRGRGAHQVHEQPQADRLGAAQLRGRPTRSFRRRTSPPNPARRRLGLRRQLRRPVPQRAAGLGVGNACCCRSSSRTISIAQFDLERAVLGAGQRRRGSDQGRDVPVSVGDRRQRRVRRAAGRAPIIRHGVPIISSNGSPIFFAHSHYVTNAGIHQPWGRDDAYCYDYDIPEPIPENGNHLARIDGPFYRNSKMTVASGVRRLVEHDLHRRAHFGPEQQDLGRRGAGRGDAAAARSAARGRRRTTAAGCLVGIHSGPDTHDHPEVIIHAPNNPFGHTDEMWGEHGDGCNVLFGDGRCGSSRPSSTR